MTEQPDSPLLALAIGMGLAGIAYLCHRALIGLDGKPAPNWLSGQLKNSPKLEYFQRSTLELFLLSLKWLLGFGAALMAIYPIIYLIKFAGR